MNFVDVLSRLGDVPYAKSMLVYLFCFGRRGII